MTHTPQQWQVALALVALFAVAGVLIFALQQGTLWAAAVSGGVISRILLAISWALRPVVPRLSAALVGAAAVPATLLWLTIRPSPRAAARRVSLDRR
ncbi:MAG TPA: hypothetical protein VFU41_15460 [Gemmatimonadales bacterium]|nr:hypothetical protein [Gemmatimonadales bacterium]